MASPRWCPTDSEVPGASVNVLVQMKDGNRQIYRRIWVDAPPAESESPGRWVWANTLHWKEMDDSVAWCELPEPYVPPVVTKHANRWNCAEALTSARAHFTTELMERLDAATEVLLERTDIVGPVFHGTLSGKFFCKMGHDLDSMLRIPEDPVEPLRFVEDMELIARLSRPRPLSPSF